ncbi:hypothetical protein H5410_027343 [Solanum commersonii]|uniref:Uncharacterized protein n=1 Tax=Solanum commersonii TaxID=4109 RepID=A0A9J5YYU9_SOLCO|nr:hypothetical protein H5410_027343 [Solanum commersonii]
MAQLHITEDVTLDRKEWRSRIRVEVEPSVFQKQPLYLHEVAVERSRKMMTRSVMSKKAMEWICFCLKEASKEHKKETRRWKLAERETELSCTKKQNEYGKFMSLITLNSGGRSGLIIPELALNAGWVDIALKIERFIKSQQREKEHSFSRVTEDEYSYAEAVQQSKWGEQ